MIGHASIPVILKASLSLAYARTHQERPTPPRDRGPLW